LVDEPQEEISAEQVADARTHPGVLVCIAIGGALGALSRYGVSRLIHVPTDGFPRSTFVINVSGAFVLGCFLTVIRERQWSARYVRPLFAIGFLGAFTTFSTMAVDTVTLIKDGHAAVGIGYLLLSVAAGVASCVLGVLLGRTSRPRALGSA
jgi:fluoride exporter